MLVTIDRYLNPVEAHIVKGRLEVEGIKASVQHKHHIWADWTLSLALGYVKVQIDSQDIAAATAVLEKLQAGEYELAEEKSDFEPCVVCGGLAKNRIDWSVKLALCMVVLFNIVLPYNSQRVQCVECQHAWSQSQLRGYPLCVPFFAVMVVATVLYLVLSISYYICKINYWSNACI